MTRKLLALALALGAGGYARGQGIVRFANDSTSGINAPFYDADGVTRLAGSTFRAALYWGPFDSPSEVWSQAGPGSAFVNNGFWISGDRMLPVPGGLSVWLQVRFWDSQNGTYAYYEQAEANGAKVGISKPILVVLNPPPTVTPMTGLQSASVVPTITLSRGMPGIVTDSSTVANGTQLTNLCGTRVGLNRWFRLTSPYAGETLVTTTGSSIDTVMSAYTGSIISPSSLTLLTCNDDGGAGVPESEVRFAVEANKLYLLCVAGKNGATGTIRLNHTLLTNLAIRRSDLGRIELSWPADASNFVAEANSQFPPDWRSITNTPVAVGSRNIVERDCSDRHELFRLRLRN